MVTIEASKAAQEGPAEADHLAEEVPSDTRPPSLSKYNRVLKRWATEEGTA
ncbi:hypothetical protein ACIRVF_31435 [Kitasatospora sp. NPDC101157]|uniref:hypothetical protein n=1 Tax=Kitasatospora sp. NPDC101157 TaxID=3364098 RepID=UPI00382553E7